MISPVALVLDDVHMLRNPECQAALSVLADHVPGGSRLALAGRSRPPLRVARLRAEGRILEIGSGDLSLTQDEAFLLLRNADIAVGEEDLTELHRRTEGWPAGLYLAALYLREGGPLASAAVRLRRGADPSTGGRRGLPVRPGLRARRHRRPAGHAGVTRPGYAPFAGLTLGENFSTPGPVIGARRRPQ